MTSALLQVRGLRVTYAGPPEVRALGVDLHVDPGECLAILGESGSGKSTLALALLGLTTGTRLEGRVCLGDQDGPCDPDEAGWNALRWTRIALAFQSESALNPVLRVGRQIVEPLVLHLGMDHGTAGRRAQALLDEVGLGAWAADHYPGELSGGQRRLVLLAMALSCDPEVLVLDEPTAGLDSVSRDHVLALLAERHARPDRAMLIITHDADAAAALADRVAILYRGWLTEVGPTASVLDDPRHPYTWALLNARPTLAGVKDLRGIRGSAADPSELSVGCPFRDRCTQAIASCATTRPELAAAANEVSERTVSCLRGGVVTVLAARNLHKAYTGSSKRGRRRKVVLDGVDLDVREGEVVALVGPTGSGKSTLARILLRLDEADQGAVEIEGRDLLALDGAELRAARQRIQLLFQDPFEAFSPRMTVGEAIREPLDVQRVGTPREREEAVDRALAAVGLAAGLAGRRTHELSGGQLQRVALARALALRPKLLVADEPVAHLDPSEQAKVLQMLKSLQVESGMAMLLISHDLAVVLRVADRILVLDGGHVVERGTGTSLFLAPQHPTTRALLGAAGRDAFLRRLDRAGTALAAPDPPPARQQVLVGAALTNTDHMEGSE